MKEPITSQLEPEAKDLSEIRECKTGRKIEKLRKKFLIRAHFKLKHSASKNSALSEMVTEQSES